MTQKNKNLDKADQEKLRQKTPKCHKKKENQLSRMTTTYNSCLLYHPYYKFIKGNMEMHAFIFCPILFDSNIYT